jgi:4-diphosphocytidyl-2-C-methyl-D-erythritol kinase
MSLTALYDLPAPAKINRFLHVVGRRDDGYHLLETVFQLIDWSDTLHVELDRSGQLKRTDLSAALPTEDLCLKAARALQSASGTALGAHIFIDKQVPWGAGLGGGSSDAATTLLALNRLWGLHWPREQLLRLAVTLGADVPFFVGGRNAWATGIGDVLHPLELPRQALVVIKPDVNLPTPKIFSSPHLSRSTPRSRMIDFLADQDEFGRNDLQICACAESQEVVTTIDAMKLQFGNARMTGSGSAVFSRVDKTENASGRMRQVVATLPSAWKAKNCSSLEIHPLHSL